PTYGTRCRCRSWFSSARKRCRSFLLPPNPSSVPCPTAVQPESLPRTTAGSWARWSTCWRSSSPLEESIPATRGRRRSVLVPSLAEQWPRVLLPPAQRRAQQNRDDCEEGPGQQGCLGPKSQRDRHQIAGVGGRQPRL